MQEASQNEDNTGQPTCPETQPPASQAVAQSSRKSISSCASDDSNQLDDNDHSDDPTVISETSGESDTDVDLTW